MMIDLNNYEEYFLLYIDNELSADKRAAVEAFVLQHPHLAAELDMLQDTKLPIEENISFNNKTALYKTASNSININNYEEYFLLHTDKELSAEQEQNVEQFVLQHPQLQEAFLLLQRAKLVPEHIECPGKHRLYKQPAKRIIPLYVTRMAVAAAIMGVIVTTGIFLFNKHDAANTPQIAVTIPQGNTPETTLPPINADGVLPTEKKKDDVVLAKNKVNKIEKKAAQQIETVNQLQAAPGYNESEHAPVIAKVELEPAPTTPAIPPAPEGVATVSNTSHRREQVTTLKPLEEVDEKSILSTVMYAPNEDDATTKPAVYKELNTNEDNQTLYVGSLQLNKAKVNGLFKKAAHLLGGKAKESNL